ncbi:MAG: alpha/beta fold hydrolase [Bacteroidales bacterium]|jgi:pimeloyl-ACP methyl ester carboxylesterase|nr:alpha/beta fold hydrolase [Bacteroidales bacterium]
MKLFYRKYGKGPPLVILHGLYGSSDNWVSIARRISGHYTVYLPDQRNHGQSPWSDINDYDSMSMDLFELVSELRLKRFFLAGHSMGGKTAVNFSQKWPEMIEGLLIADISPFSNEKNKTVAFNEHHIILTAITGTDFSKAVSRTEIDRLLEEKIHSEKVRGLILKNLQRDAENKFSWKLNAMALLDNLDKITEGFPYLSGDYQQITGFPVLFLKGENSEYISIKDYTDIIRLFPAAEIRVIKDAGHWLNADNPDAVSEALVSLLKDR